MNNIDLNGQEEYLAKKVLLANAWEEMIDHTDRMYEKYVKEEKEHDHQYDVEAEQQTKEYNDHLREEAFFSSFSDR